MGSPGLRLAVDTGGTFTDIVVLNEETGTFVTGKVPTTLENTLIGVLNAIEKVDLDLSKVETLFILGSTTAMNCLLEGKGAKTAYLTTMGFRDVPEIGLYDRPDLYNIKYKKTPPPVSRELRFDIPERLDYEGQVLTALDVDALRRVVGLLKAKAIESVAVCFLHSFRNPVHERRAKELILEAYPQVSVSISSDIVREHREYQRSMTTILDAYLKSTIRSWVSNVEEELVRRGFRGELVVVRSDGGAMTSEVAKHSPISTLLSGPSGGVAGGLFLANHFNHRNLVTLDMGGTSTDVCLISDGRVFTKREAVIGDWTILLSNMGVETVGAGGGTIARIGEEGTLKVGPQSAGAAPGPVCYMKGGVEPTVTDAALVCGYIDPHYFLGGEMRLDVACAANAIESRLARPLNMDLLTASSGILRLAISNMANAIREVTIAKGQDSRGFELLCYGGAGPIFGAYLMDDLEMQSVIIPIAPGNFSAWGMLTMGIRHDFSLTVSEPLDRIQIEDLGDKFEQMLRDASGTLDSEKIPPGDRTILRSLDMRYVKQEHTVEVPIDFTIDGSSRDKLYEEFAKAYKRVWGYSIEGEPAAIVHIRVTALGRVPQPRLAEVGGGDPKSAYKGSRRAFCLLGRRWESYTVYERAMLPAHSIIAGPALIEESTSVTIVPSVYYCEVDEVGNLIVKRNRS